MKDVNFEPWVGKDYEKGYNGKKIMILGDSHYCNEETCLATGCCSDKKGCNITELVIENYLGYMAGYERFERWMNTFTNFIKVFLGDRQCDSSRIIEFLNSVMFYNYVQKAVIGESGNQAMKSPPTEQMYKDSESAFFSILNEYEPNITFVWGMRLFHNLKNCVSNVIEDENGGKKCYIKGSTKPIPAYAHNHPSMGFGYRWSPYLKKAFESA